MDAPNVRIIPYLVKAWLEVPGMGRRFRQIWVLERGHFYLMTDRFSLGQMR